MTTYKIILILFFVSFINVFSQKYEWRKIIYEKYNGKAYENDYVAIDNADSLHIMAVDTGYPPDKVYFNRVVRSTDAGVTWDTVYQDAITNKTIVNARSMSYPTKDFCIVGFKDYGYLIKTTDGGDTWTSFELDLGSNHYFGIEDIHMIDDKVGALAYGVNVLYTEDCFETYKVVPNPREHSRIFNVHVVAPQTLLAIVYDYTIDRSEACQFIYKTTNAGETWEKLYTFNQPYFDLEDMQFIDSEFGYVVGSIYIWNSIPFRNIIYKTEDGGRNWKKVLDTIVLWNPRGIQNIDVLDRRSAIATSQFGVVYWTHDGGESWQLDSNTNILEYAPATLFPCILGEHTALIADFHDRIFRSYLITSDIQELPQYYTNISLSPNPATDFITINYDYEGNRASSPALIYDILGVKVAQEPLINGSNKINISHLTPGVYFIKIGDRVEKFIKI